MRLKFNKRIIPGVILLLPLVPQRAFAYGLNEDIGRWIGSFADGIAEIFLGALRSFLYLIMTLPLLISSAIGDAADLFAGIAYLPPGQSIIEQAEMGAAPAGRYDDFICIDLERLFVQNEVEKFKSNENVYYGIHEVKSGEARVAASQPFRAFDWNNNEPYKRMQKLWDTVPAHFRNGKHMREDFIERYAAAVYCEDPMQSKAMDIKTGQMITPVKYSFEGTDRYYIPGKDEYRSKSALFETPKEAAADHFWRTFNFTELKPYTRLPRGTAPYEAEVRVLIDGGTANSQDKFLGVTPPDKHTTLGAAVSIVPHEIANRRVGRVEYEIAKTSSGTDVLSWLEGANLQNRWMYKEGYSAFHDNPGWRGASANFKYWNYDSLGMALGTYPTHFCSIELYYPAKTLWCVYIDNNSQYVTDRYLPANSMSRYSPATQAWLQENGIAPGSDNMYRQISEMVNEGRNLEPVVIHEAARVTLFDVILGQSGVSRAFWGITLLAFALCLGFSIFAVVRSMGDLRLKRPVGKVMHMLGKAMLILFLIPALFIVTINLTNICLSQINYVFNSAIAGAANPGETIDTEAAILSAAVTPESIRDNPNASEAALYDIRGRLVRGEIDWRNFESFNQHFDALRMYVAPTIVAGWFTAVMMLLIMMMFIRRIFDMLLLYISAPFFVAAMPLDDGNKFKAWRNMFVSKAVMGFSALITLKMALLFLPVLWSGNLRTSNNDLLDILFKMTIMMGGMYAAYKSQAMISTVLNTQAGGAEKETTAFFSSQTVGRAGRILKAPGNFVAKEVKAVGMMVHTQETRSFGGAIHDAALWAPEKVIGLAAGNKDFKFKPYLKSYQEEQLQKHYRDIVKYKRQIVELSEDKETAGNKKEDTK